MTGGFEKVWYLSVYHGKSDIPKEVCVEVQKMWADLCLSNDVFFHRASVRLLEEQNYSLIARHIKEHLPDLSIDEDVHINFWW